MGEHENLMKKQAEPYGVLQSLAGWRLLVAKPKQSAVDL
jgi:hypothetical protein